MMLPARHPPRGEHRIPFSPYPARGVARRVWQGSAAAGAGTAPLSARPCPSRREPMPPCRHCSGCSQQWGFRVTFAQQSRSIQVGPFTPQVLAAKGRFSPDTDAPRERRDAEQTSAARLDPEQPKAAGRAGWRGHWCSRPGPRSQGLCVLSLLRGRWQRKKSPGK